MMALPHHPCVMVIVKVEFELELIEKNYVTNVGVQKRYSIYFSDKPESVTPW
jgi:hypothetical protein